MSSIEFLKKRYKNVYIWVLCLNAYNRVFKEKEEKVSNFINENKDSADPEIQSILANMYEWKMDIVNQLNIHICEELEDNPNVQGRKNKIFDLVSLFKEGLEMQGCRENLEKKAMLFIDDTRSDQDVEQLNAFFLELKNDLSRSWKRGREIFKIIKNISTQKKSDVSQEKDVDAMVFFVKCSGSRNALKEILFDLLQKSGKKMCIKTMGEKRIFIKTGKNPYSDKRVLKDACGSLASYVLGDSPSFGTVVGKARVYADMIKLGEGRNKGRLYLERIDTGVNSSPVDYCLNLVKKEDDDYSQIEVRTRKKNAMLHKGKMNFDTEEYAVVDLKAELQKKLQRLQSSLRYSGK